MDEQRPDTQIDTPADRGNRPLGDELLGVGERESAGGRESERGCSAQAESVETAGAERARTTIADPPKFGRHYRPEGGEDLEGEAGLDADGDGLSDSESPAGFVGHLVSAAEPVMTAVEPIVEHVVMPVAGAIGNAIVSASQAFGVRDAITDRFRRSAPEPLPNLYEVRPEARLAAPRELGFRFVPIEDIRGTAVAGIAQRGTDFQPLPPFRGANWEGRWQRIRDAYTRLQPLPPVDLIKYDGEYWVVDGHNRVAASLDAHGVGLDAMVVELVPMDRQVSERPSGVLSFIGDGGALRTAAQGHRPAVGTRISVPGAERAAGPADEETPQPADPEADRE